MNNKMENKKKFKEIGKTVDSQGNLIKVYKCEKCLYRSTSEFVEHECQKFKEENGNKRV